MLERLKIDVEGVAEVLVSATVAEVVRDAAGRVADAARAQGHRITSGAPLPIEVHDDPDRDRAGTSVSVQHPSGVGMEARYGMLKRAASSVGLHANELDPKPARTTRRTQRRRKRRS